MVTVAGEQGKVPDGSLKCLPGALAEFAQSPDIANTIRSGRWLKTLSGWTLFERLHEDVVADIS